MNKSVVIIICAAVIAAVSIILFVMMGVDKSKARRGARRISEKALMLTALFGGGLGGILGMLAFRHKTKHTKFIVGFPLLTLLNFAIAGVVIWFACKGGM